VPVFRIKKQVYNWIKSGEKTIELRRGISRHGDSILFLGGRGESIKVHILKKQEGKLEDLLNRTTYSKIVPPAKNLDEAFEFIKNIYPFTEGTFTTYEFRLDEE
jgi:ASC-1-like (ASCH) protein